MMSLDLIDERHLLDCLDHHNGFKYLTYFVKIVNHHISGGSDDENGNNHDGYERYP
jgi:hypothetical protein